MIFSELRYHDPFYPVPNWYGGWGFETKRKRVAFDAVRLGLGTCFYAMPSFLSNNKDGWEEKPKLTVFIAPQHLLILSLKF